MAMDLSGTYLYAGLSILYDTGGGNIQTTAGHVQVTTDNGNQQWFMKDLSIESINEYAVLD
jgi:hypothetical protein